jgi:hypothetical protein
MKIAFYGVVFAGVVGVTTLIISEIPAVKIRLHKAIARRLAMHRKGRPDLGVCHSAPAENPGQSELVNAASTVSVRELEEAVALAVEVERARHEPYPREWE